MITVVYSVVEYETEHEAECNKMQIGGKWYEKEVLWGNIGRPYNLNVHKGTNTLFFSYALPETYSEADFQLAYYHIDTRNYDTIAGIQGGCAIAVDQYNDIVYLGGTDGIFKYNMMTKIADQYREQGKNIWALFYKRNLFYINYPNQKLYIEIEETFSLVKEFEDFEVDNFFVSSNNEIYFANRSGYFRYDNEKLRAILINEFITVRQIVEDNDENLYLSTNAGVFANTGFYGLKKIIPQRNIYGIAFDRDNNLIYADDSSIIQLKPSDTGCPDENKGHW
ncbi:ommochrome-binding protein-like [Phthorimaea operculella]|nr:ommochrome-binding protein-like [Phthorimaea operculella]